MTKTKTLLLGFLGTIFVDQISKFLFAKYTQMWFNAGISFGLLGKLDGYILLFLILIALFVLWRVFARAVWQQYPLATGVLFGAAVSNAVDRVFFGGVRDWMWMPVLNVHNNFADWAIFFAIVWIMKKEIWHK